MLDRLDHGLYRLRAGLPQRSQLNVENVDEVRAFLRDRDVDVSEIQNYPWGRFCFFSDRRQRLVNPQSAARVGPMSETSQPPPRRRPPHGWMPHPDVPAGRTPSSSTRAPLAMAPVAVDNDGRSWRIGTANDVAWIAGHTIDGPTVTNAIPPRSRRTPPFTNQRVRTSRSMSAPSWTS